MLSVLLMGCLLNPLPIQGMSPPPGFVPLFNGRDMSGWHGWDIHAKDASPLDLAKVSSETRAKKQAAWTENAKKHWSVQNGELVNDGHGAYLATDKEFRDYELLLEYRTVPKADSGIYLKSTPQVQIWDYTEQAKFNIGADKGSGGLWNNSAGAKGKDPLVLADRPLGEWNQFRILQIGDRTTVWLNGQLVVDDAVMENYWDRKQPLFAQGSILLQTHGGEIRWRNIFLREISTHEANAWLRARSNSKYAAASPGGESVEYVLVQEPRRGLLSRLRGRHETWRMVPVPVSVEKRAGFQSLFNGMNLEGWAGAVDNYEVKDNAIVCKPGKGGVLHTRDEYGDFVARLEFKLPRGGNNGLAIRYPGQGDTAYVGLCEIQVLDDTDAKYSRLDPRQYNGSVYGMIASKRGFLRPVGEWNFEEVTVQGSRIKVELNGTVIVDGDVSQVKEFLGGKPHPGMNRTQGSFGFAGHSDPVMFRNIEIKKLP